MRSRFSIRLLVLMAPLVAVAGTCQGPVSPVDVRVDDRNQFTPGGRIAYEIYPGIDQRREGTLLDLMTGSSVEEGGSPETQRRSRVQPTISIEGEIVSVEGGDRQPVAAGTRVELGGVNIPGPTVVRIEAKSISARIAARGGVRFFDVVSLEGILGLGLDTTEVRFRGGGFDTSDQDPRAAFVVGARLTVRPIPLFDLYGQATVSTIGADTVSTDQQLGVELNLTRNISVFGGYRWWEYKEDEMASGSDVDIDIDGPTAGLSLRF